MLVVLKNLVTIRMIEIFAYLAFCREMLNLFFGNRDKDDHKFCKRKVEENTGTIVFNP